jgi:hypothetical protein
MDWKNLLTPENITSFATTLAMLVGSLFLAWKTFKKKLDAYLAGNDSNIPGKIRKQSNMDLDILQKLEEVKEILNADRIQIFEFHNGGHYANGRSALKTTCTYETCRYGIRSYQSQLSCIPLSCITKFISTLLDNGKVSILDLKDIENTMPATYALKKSMQINSCFDMIIKNTQGNPVGFVAIQFCTNKYNINEEIVQKLVWFLEEKLASSMA